MEFRFHTLAVGQSIEIDAAWAANGIQTARAYQRHWRKMGWGYAATETAGGGLRITRLPDRVGSPQRSAEITTMPENYRALLEFRIETEILRVFEKVLNDGVEHARRLPGLKPEHIEAGVVPVSVLRNYCVKLAVFREHPFGRKKTFQMALEKLITKAALEFSRANHIVVVKAGVNYAV